MAVMIYLNLDLSILCINRVKWLKIRAKIKTTALASGSFAVSLFIYIPAPINRINEYFFRFKVKSGDNAQFSGTNAMKSSPLSFCFANINRDVLASKFSESEMYLFYNLIFGNTVSRKKFERLRREINIPLHNFVRAKA